jgi:magnesium-transporting ATPase (P-type)
MLCNESNIYEENGEFRVDGDPMEGALVVSAMKAGLNPEEEKSHYPPRSIIPFESERGFMATLHQHDGRQFIFLKGSPEKVLEMCTQSTGVLKLTKRRLLRPLNILHKTA